MKYIFSIVNFWLSHEFIHSLTLLFMKCSSCVYRYDADTNRMSRTRNTNRRCDVDDNDTTMKFYKCTWELLRISSKYYPVSREILLILFIIILPHFCNTQHSFTHSDVVVFRLWEPPALCSMTTQSDDIIKGSQILIICRLRIWIWPFLEQLQLAEQSRKSCWIQSTFHFFMIINISLVRFLILFVLGKFQLNFFTSSINFIVRTSGRKWILLELCSYSLTIRWFSRFISIEWILSGLRSFVRLWNISENMKNHFTNF